MALRTQTWRNDPTDTSSRPRRYYICDSLADRPSSGLLAGDVAFTIDTAKIYRATNATTWTEIGGGAGGGATLLSELDDVDDALAATNGHFLVADGTDWSNRVLAEADIPAAIARDTEVAQAVTDHVALADPHTQYQKESEKGAASGYASLNGSTKVVEDPANATSTATASKIPIADGSGKLDTWVSDASTTTKGKVELATDGESAAGLAVQSNDGRLSNARTPSAHSTSHQSGGGDAIKLDDLATPDDNTDLDASTTRHGLLPKLGGGTTNFLRADGTWAAPPGGGSGPTYQALSSDAATNSTVNFATVMTTVLATGTYVARYYIRYQAALTTTGVKFQLSSSGGLVVSAVPHTTWYQTTGGAAATAAADQATTTTAQMIEGWSGRALNTALGPSLSVDTANADQLQVLEALIVVTTGGSLLLQHASEVAAASTVKAGTALILHKVA